MFGPYRCSKVLRACPVHFIQNTMLFDLVKICSHNVIAYNTVMYKLLWRSGKLWTELETTKVDSFWTGSYRINKATKVDSFWTGSYGINKATTSEMKTCSLTSYAHTMVKPPDPIRTPKLSTIGPAQYCGGGPRGNRRWCTFFTLTSTKTYLGTVIWWTFLRFQYIW